MKKLERRTYDSLKGGVETIEAGAWNQACDEWEKYHIEVTAELLEALKRILDTGTMTTAVHAMDESYEIARRAIAKAEGV